MKAKINNSLFSKLDNLDEIVEKKLKDDLESKAAYITKTSPSDTGAYVTSWSMKDNYSSGRSKTSKNKPRNVNRRPEGYQNLVSDIAALDLKKGLVVISNGAPHARYVRENAEIFAAVKNLYKGRKGI
ncbi:MAG: hypothetical protein HRU18_06345 [Pseudoalteromonas sp.]|uniref:hypothetical protein n=1 Tax=Pseudoalteromonas sp. TaxID=53249 RepID=UPI001D61835B|nr:hypothetical protein [Pseudoalteromonas sp.]NRA77810.1 hypothetical protein [Pseudoalteromonas sp.]